MVMDILNKIFLFLFIFSFLNVLRHSFFIYRSIKMNEKFVIDGTNLFFLGVSISYIITSIIVFIKSLI